MKVDQIEPKLLLQEVDYEEVVEMLKEHPESLKREPADIEYVFEGTRVQVRDSNAPAERK